MKKWLPIKRIPATLTTQRFPSKELIPKKFIIKLAKYLQTLILVQTEKSISQKIRWHGPHITGLPGVWCSVFTASQDVSDFFYRKLVKNAKLAIFGDIQVPIWQRCENLVILVL